MNPNKPSKRITLMILLATFAACRNGATPATTSGNGAPSDSAAANTTSPPSAATTTTASMPKDFIALADGASLKAGPFAWPPGGSSIVVTDDASGDAKLLWRGTTGHGTVSLPGAAKSGIVTDLTKDGAPELALFGDRSAAPSEPVVDDSTTWIVGIDPSTKHPARMWALELAVRGANDGPSLAREVAALDTFSAGPDPVKMIAHLAHATPADLQALSAPSGVKICKRQGERRSCKAVATKDIDAINAKKIAGSSRPFATFAPEGDRDLENALQPPSCAPDERAATRLRCSANVGGPEGTEWVFDRSSGSLRLAEVWSWAEDS